MVISITRVDPGDTDVDGLRRSLEEGLRPLGGLPVFLRGRESALIKPNLTAGAPAESGGTTDVRLVEAIARLALDCGLERVAVGEGAGAECDTDRAFEKLGYTLMASRLGIALLNLDRYGYVEAPVSLPCWKPTIEVSRALFDYETYITVPCLKTHPGCGITVAVKNAFGTLPDGVKVELHREEKVEEALVDLLSVRPPDLVVVDGLVGSQGIGGGTEFRHPVRASLLVCGGNAVAVDRVCCELMSQNPRIRNLEWAAQRGLGPSSLDGVEVAGVPVEEARLRFLTPSEQLAADIGSLRIDDSEACTGCRNAVAGALLRLKTGALTSPVTVSCGKGTGVRRAEGGVLHIAVGDCACRAVPEACTAAVRGCPASAIDVLAALNDGGAVCARCEDAAREALALVPSFRGRVLAAGRTVGGTGDTDLTVLVGDCMERYHQMNANRSRKSASMGTGLERKAAFVKGCPPQIDAMVGAMAAGGRRRLGARVEGNSTKPLG